MLYVVDSSSPETIGASTLFLVDLLRQPGLESAHVMVVFTKTDLPAAIKLREIQMVMRWVKRECSIIEYGSEAIMFNYTYAS